MKSPIRACALSVLSLALTLSACSPPPSGNDAASDGSSSESSVQMDSSRPDSAVSNDGAVMDSGASTDVTSATDSSASDSAASDSAAGSDATSATDASDSAMTTDAMSSMDSAMTADAASDAASSLDARGDSASDAALTCSMLGDWSTTAGMGLMLAFRFQPDGTWQGATNPDSLGTAAAIPTGNYSTATGNIVLTNDPGGSGCMMADRGEYRLTYDPTCGSVVWTLVSDTCTARATALNGSTLRRYMREAGVADAGSDAAVPDAAVSDGGACSMRASWATTFGAGGMMAMVGIRFNAGGTWEGSPTVAGLMGGMTVALGNYSEPSGRIVLTNDPGIASGCTMADRGEYAVTFGPGCTTARWTVVSDTCTSRSSSLDGAAFTRL